MDKKIPRTPFSTPLSGSARETEIRLKNIFSGPKKRPPALFLALVFSVCLLCGNLVSCQVAEAETLDTSSPSGISTPDTPEPPSNVPTPNIPAAPKIIPVPEQDQTPVQTPAKPAPAADTAEPQIQKLTQPVLEDRWGVPADPIPEGTEIFVANRAEADALINYLRQARGITEAGDIGYTHYDDGRISVSVHYTYSKEREAALARLPDGVYPVNSKGETYGSEFDYSVVGYAPDLVKTIAENGMEGYVVRQESRYHGYTGRMETLEDIRAYMEWLETQPSTILIPVYDVNHDNVVGYYAIDNGTSNGLTPEEELELIAQQMRNWGSSEEQIAQDLEYYKQSNS